MISPYAARPDSEWKKITEQLVAQFPLPMNELVTLVKSSWEDIYTSSFGDTNIRIGKDIFLPAQATGVILEKLFAVRIAQRFSDWRGGETKIEKDIVCMNDDRFSFEIKTSSSRTGLYGNRSTGHRTDRRTKFRSGYYLVINYKLPKEDDSGRKIYNIRFGWIDDEDWVGQAQPSGQQASIGVKLARLKLVSLYSDI